MTIIPDWYYNFYGDDRPLRDNYEMMKRFVLYHEQTNLKPDATTRFLHLWRLGRRRRRSAAAGRSRERRRGR